MSLLTSPLPLALAAVCSTAESTFPVVANNAEGRSAIRVFLRVTRTSKGAPHIRMLFVGCIGSGGGTGTDTVRSIDGRTHPQFLRYPRPCHGWISPQSPGDFHLRFVVLGQLTEILSSPTAPRQLLLDHPQRPLLGSLPPF